jgi:hypothetical protein
MSIAGTGRDTRLKDQRGWFAAGASFRRALTLLSDGAFKLFAWLCLESMRNGGQIETTHSQLARTLGKSKRGIGRWIGELESKGVCDILPGSNQHERTRIKVCDSYWPYHRSLEAAALNHSGSLPAETSNDSYVETVRASFLKLDCGKATFSASDEEFARELERREVPLHTVEDALLLGAARKYQSWLNGNVSARIGSLRYFESVIDEATRSPLTEDYRGYLRRKIKEYSTAQSQSRSPATPGPVQSS